MLGKLGLKPYLLRYKKKWIELKSHEITVQPMFSKLTPTETKTESHCEQPLSAIYFLCIHGERQKKVNLNKSLNPLT